MTYRVYSGPKGAPDPSPIEKQKMLYKEFTSLDEALWWANHLSRRDRVALSIEGDDGTQLDRRAIGAAIGSSGVHARSA
ncbi:MAG: hypothetical protein KIT76_11005 [Pseudolabrys sp.]|jgi:hypothetical protein|nr:hypothetical protein [Pseudolabrys sp.]